MGTAGRSIRSPRTLSISRLTTGSERAEAHRSARAHPPPYMPHKRDPGFLDLFDVRRLAARRRSGLDAPVQLGFLMLVVLMGVGSWMSYRHTQRLYDSEAFVAH